MPQTQEIQIRVMDLPEVQAVLAECERKLESLRRERDEWEERYEDLLAAVGGVWPG